LRFEVEIIKKTLITGLSGYKATWEEKYLESLQNLTFSQACAGKRRLDIY